MKIDGRQTGWWTRPAADLVDVAEEIFERDAPPAFWAGNTLDVDAMERFDEQATSVVRPEYWQQALEFHGTLESKKETYLKHARHRAELAKYLRDIVTPETGVDEFRALADKLLDARQFGFWGVDPMDDERPAVQWTNRVGQVKLCPDDAREDQVRAAKRYTDRIVAFAEAGALVRFGVLSMPNAPAWYLGATMDAAFKRLRNEIVYGRVDGLVARSIKDPKRRFPNLLGAWACLETPLSARYREDPANAWNVHLNVMTVWRPDPAHPKGWPDYEALNDAWGAWVQWQEVKGDADAVRAAIFELIKYPLKAVSFKSAEHAARDRAQGRAPAPPVVDWPAWYFFEWWEAHKGFRRAKNWGCLHTNFGRQAPRCAACDGVLVKRACTDETCAEYGRVKPRPKEERRNPDLCDWFGSIRLSPSSCVISAPMPDTSWLEWQRDWERDQRARVYSIQGNKFARGLPPGFGKDGQSRGPPDG